MREEIEILLRRSGWELASIGKRGVAFFIDELLLTTLFMFILWDGISQAKTMEELLFVTNAYVLEYMGMKILYQTVFTALYGASLGKMAVKIRVVTMDEGALPSWPVAFNRAVFRAISEMIFYLGFIWAMFDPGNQGWHDRTARTVVVNA